MVETFYVGALQELMDSVANRSGSPIRWRYKEIRLRKEL